MAEAADTAPAQRRQPASSVTTATAGDASAMLQQALGLLFPSNLAAKAALFALVVALLPLLPSGQEAPARIWELPYLLLLGIVISYGIFGQKNADAAEVAGDADAKAVVDEEAAVEAYVSQMMQGSLPLVFEGDGDRGGDPGASKDGVQAWSSRYLPDDPLVVVADTAGTDGDTGEKPLLLPVRKLKPTEPATATLTGEGDVHMSDIIEEEEEEEEEVFLAPSKAAGLNYAVHDREHAAIPSPPSVLDADLTLSPPSPPLLPPPPPPPPFLDRGRVLGKAKARSFNEFVALGSRSTIGARLGLHSAGDDKRFRSRSAVQATRRRAFAGYEPVVPIDDEADDEKLEEMVAASDDSSSFSSDAVATADVDDDDDNDAIMEEINSCDEDDRSEDDGNSCDEELFELAARPGALAETEEEEDEEVEDEVDRKADEFIAKFREQIRMQRGEPATRR